MALLRIEAGALSFERTATNTKADRVVTQCALAWGYSGSPSDKAAVLAFFGSALVSRIEEAALAEEERRSTATALAASAADRPSWESA